MARLLLLVLRILESDHLEIFVNLGLHDFILNGHDHPELDLIQGHVQLLAELFITHLRVGIADLFNGTQTFLLDKLVGIEPDIL